MVSQLSATLPSCIGGLGRDLLEGGAAGDQVLEVRGLVEDLLARRVERARSLARSALASSKGMVFGAMIALTR